MVVTPSHMFSLHMPKSAIFTWPSESSITLSSFRSLWGGRKSLGTSLDAADRQSTLSHAFPCWAPGRGRAGPCPPAACDRAERWGTAHPHPPVFLPLRSRPSHEDALRHRLWEETPRKAAWCPAGRPWPGAPRGGSRGALVPTGATCLSLDCPCLPGAPRVNNRSREPDLTPGAPSARRSQLGLPAKPFRSKTASRALATWQTRRTR